MSVHRRLLLSPWAVALGFVALIWLALGVSAFTAEPVTGSTDALISAVVTGLAGAAGLALSLWSLARTFMIITATDVWIGWRRLRLTALADVQLTVVGGSLLDADAPVLVTTGGGRIVLTGLAGYSFGDVNRRVLRQANFLRSAIGLAPLTAKRMSPTATPKRSK